MKTINHTEYPKRLRVLSNESLEYIIKDCKEALNSMPNNPNNGYYQDEINYCVNEIAQRKTAKMIICQCCNGSGRVNN